MRVGVHLQALSPGEIGGLEIYVRALVEHLPELAPEITLVLVGTAENLPTFADQRAIEKVELTDQQFACLDRDAIARWNLDLWFCPLLTLEPHEPGLPSVVTIPDLQHETYPQFFSPEILAWRHLHYPRSLARADRVLTLSDHARGQILDRFGVDPERIVAIPLDGGPGLVPEQTSDSSYLAAVAERYELPNRFFCYPGNTWPHKNHAKLFDALALLRERQPDVELVLTGAHIESDKELDVGDLASAVHFLGHVPREDLAGIFALSTGLVFPSLFEGFGIPVVEAMRIGCPVAASSVTSLPEVGGDAILYFDPRDPAEIASRLEQLCLDPHLRDELVAAGRRQARRFAWRDTASRTLEVFQEAIENAGGSPFPVPTLPEISVVVPSYQQAEFLPRTLDSILTQGYPSLQIVVIDGGSTDGSVEILEGYRERYPEQLEFVSETDRGQAHAVNKGLARARGEIIGWLNSDDIYAPGALIAVGRELASNQECDVLYGRADYIDADDQHLGPYPVRPSFDWHALAHNCFLCQPAVFWRRRLTEEGFQLDEDLQTCMDYELWIRLGRDRQFHYFDRILAHSRIYAENKTLARRSEVFDEILRVVRRHYGWLPYSWALGQAAHRLSRRLSNRVSNRIELDPKPTWKTVVLATATLLRHNLPRPAHWAGIWREIRSASSPDHRASLNHREIQAPGSWRGLLLKAGGNGAGSGEVKVYEATTGRVIGRIAPALPGPSEAVIGLPRRNADRFHRLRLEEEIAGLEVSHFDLLPRLGRLRLPTRWSMPSSWRSAEISVSLGNVPVEGCGLVFYLDGRETARWSFSKAGSFRRWLSLPGQATDLRVECEVGSSPAVASADLEVELLEIQEGAA